MSNGELFLRIILSYGALFTTARIMGRKEIGQMTFFNFTSSIAIGSIAANLALYKNISIRVGIAVLVGWMVLTLVMDMVDIKFRKSRRIMTGDPIIVMKNGEIVEGALRKVRIDIDELRALLRQKDVFSFLDVDYAIFESNGKLSVLKKEEKQPVTKGDLNVYSHEPKLTSIPTEVISDGEILKKNLKKLHLEEEWLMQQLENSGVQSVEQVFYAEVQTDGSLYIDCKKGK